MKSHAASKGAAAARGGRTVFHASEYLNSAGATASAIAAQGLARLPLHTYNSSDVHILDSACGPGIVSELLLSAPTRSVQEASPTTPPSPVGDNPASTSLLPLRPAPRITAIDLAPDMVEAYRARAEALGWGATAHAFVHDAGDLSCFADGVFDAVMMNLGLFMVADAAHASREMFRVLRPGGHVLVTTWKRAGVHHLLGKVVGAIRGPAAASVVSPIDAKWSRRETLSRVMLEGGFAAEEGDGVREASTRWCPGSLEEMVAFLGSSSWTDKCCAGWSAEERSRWNTEIVNQLDEDERETASVSMVAWTFVGKKM